MAETFDYTPDQVKELQKCVRDPLYFINNYAVALHPTRGLVTMKLYPYQRNIIRSMHTNKNTILLCSRQLGKTQCIAAYSVWLGIFNDDKTILITANRREAATELIDRMKIIYDNLPEWMRPIIIVNNRQELRFDNNSRIVARATSISSGRGLSVSFLICDELAFVSDNVQDLFWAAVYPTVSTGGKVVVASTPNGDSNKFYQLWSDATKGKNSFKPVMYKWDVHPDRDEAWKNETISNIGAAKFLQEYELEFITSDNVLIDPLVLTRLKDTLADYTINKFKVWKDLVPNQEYYIGVDIAEGVGQDYSSIEIYTFPQLEQVAELYDNTISVMELYAAVKWVINEINRAGGVVSWSFENNGLGYTFSTLIENDYNIPDSYIMSQKDTKYGYNTTNIEKLRSANFFRQQVEAERLRTYSADIHREMKNFVKFKQSYRAKLGYTDDCIMATLIVMRMVLDAIDNDGQLATVFFNQGYKSWESIISETQTDVINMLSQKQKKYTDDSEQYIPK